MKNTFKTVFIVFIVFLQVFNPLANSISAFPTRGNQGESRAILSNKSIIMVQKDAKRISHPLTITSSKTTSFQRAVLVVHGFQWTHYKLWERTGSMAAWLAGYDRPEDAGKSRVLVPGDNETQVSHKFFHVKPVNDGNYPDVYISNYPAGDLGPTGDNYLPPTIGPSISDYARELSEEIDYIKSKGTPFVSIVAHSMGGLVARRYIESRDFSNLPQSDPDYSEDYYHGDVDELIMLGTPNHGLFIALAATYAFAWALVSELNWQSLILIGVGDYFGNLSYNGLYY